MTYLRISCLKPDFCQLMECWCLASQGSLLIPPPSALAWEVWMRDMGPHRASLSPVPAGDCPESLLDFLSSLHLTFPSVFSPFCPHFQSGHPWGTALDVTFKCIHSILLFKNINLKLMTLESFLLLFFSHNQRCLRANTILSLKSI